LSFQVVEAAKAEVAQALARLADVERQLEAAFVSNKEVQTLEHLISLFH
jgi:hypothetical protein